MKIALITDGVWPYVIGGMQKHSYYLCKYFAQNKVEVDLYHFNKSTYNISELAFFTTEEKKYIRSVLIDLPHTSNLPGHYIRDSYKHSKLIFDDIRDKLPSYDFIYTKGFTGWYLIDQKHKGHIKCCPIGVKFHGYEMFQPMPGLRSKIQANLFLKKPVKLISQQADIVFSYGGKITELIRSLGVDENKIIEMPSGIEPETLAQKIKPTDSLIRFLYVGRYERRKGVEELTQAIAQLNKEAQRPFEFHFIGNIPEAFKLHSSNIIYHGEIRDKTELLAKMRQCDVLTCPSYSEGFPNVILEAMGNGLAVMATPVGATELLLSDKTGWIISFTDTSKIITTLKKIIDTQAQEIDERKKQALKLITENFTWDKIITVLLSKIKAI